MSTPLYPLTFQPVYKDYLWGGARIPQCFHRDAPPGIVAESWEVAARPEGMSVVADGPLKGHALDALVRMFGARLVGERYANAPFPLLVKLIDARQRLSVQVHPSDASADRYGGEAKTEIWHLLDAAPDAGVFAGLVPGTTRDAFADAVREGTCDALLRRIPVAPGDTVFIPGGLVHAIDAGCLLLEVQQNSNTTWRLYDWGRTGPDGEPRELHVDRALEVMDWSLRDHPVCTPSPEPPQGGSTRLCLYRGPYFELERVTVNARWTPATRNDAFEIWFVADGAGRVDWTDGHADVPLGTSLLIPVDVRGVGFTPDPRGTVLLRITVP